jgi:hypothetical protein
MQDDAFRPALDVVDIAHQVLDMHQELMLLRAEVAELRDYRKKYIESLNSGIRHSEEMLGGILNLALTPGVMEAIHRANADAADQDAA